MAKFKVTVDLSSFKREAEKLAKTLNPDSVLNTYTLNRIGETAIAGMKDLISKGFSPIAGKGRFPAYKNKDKYPGKRKLPRPVNLYLSGDFLDSLSSKNLKRSVSFFYKGRENQLKETGHAEGHNGQPKRPTIPEKGERFAKIIELDIDDILADRVNTLFKTIK